MIANVDGYTGKLLRTDSRPICPECGGPMKVADISKENGIQYTWYVCGQESCGGQWLEKDSPVSPIDKWRKYRQAAAQPNRP